MKNYHDLKAQLTDATDSGRKDIVSTHADTIPNLIKTSAHFNEVMRGLDENTQLMIIKTLNAALPKLAKDRSEVGVILRQLEPKALTAVLLTIKEQVTGNFKDKGQVTTLCRGFNQAQEQAARKTMAQWLPFLQDVKKPVITATSPSYQASQPVEKKHARQVSRWETALAFSRKTLQPSTKATISPDDEKIKLLRNHLNPVYAKYGT